MNNPELDEEPDHECEVDWDECYTCLECGKQGDIGGQIDRAMDYLEDR